jgi:c(7)-type cytochrome triheme protein
MNRIIVCAGAMALLLPASVSWGKIGGDITFRVKGASNVKFSHDIHVGRNGLKCAECHRLYNIAKMSSGTRMTDMQNGKYCGACHNGQKAFGVKDSCQRCHNK